MIKLWGRSTSLNVQKVLWCCGELQVEFDRTDWGGAFGGNDDPQYRAMNPNGRVPTVQDGSSILWESNTILRYLCNTRECGARLYPADAYERSKVERWMDWQLAALNPPMTTLLIGYYRADSEPRDNDSLERARKSAIQQWAIVESWLEGRDFLAGLQFTLADIGNGILAHRWYEYPIQRPDFPRIRAWYERLAGRTGFQAHVAGPVS